MDLSTLIFNEMMKMLGRGDKLSLPDLAERILAVLKEAHEDLDLGDVAIEIGRIANATTYPDFTSEQSGGIDVIRRESNA